MSLPNPAALEVSESVQSTAASAALWDSVDTLLEGADLHGILTHELGALAARRLRRLGRALPPALEAEERVARRAIMTVGPLLQRIRAASDGPMILVKGFEIARLYPGKARAFGDVDLLVPDAHSVHRALKARGFVETRDPLIGLEPHHLQPLQWPGLRLKVEIHMRPNWPARLHPPRFAELLEGASPSLVGVEGILAPNPIHHGVLLAAHAWVEDPLETLRDLVDVAAVSAGLPQTDFERLATLWRVGRIWRTTRAAADALFYGDPRAVPLRVWARHLSTVRERSVIEIHLMRWLQSFSELPPRAALAASAVALRRDMLPGSAEPWGQKLVRAQHAIRHPLAPFSSHTAGWRESSQRHARRARRFLP